MPLYLCDIIETGRVIRKGVPLRGPAGGDEAQWNSIVLGDDVRIPRRHLAWFEEDIRHPQARKIADDLDEMLAVQTRRALADLAGDRTFAQGGIRLRASIVDLLTAPPADGRWRAVQPTLSGREEMWLGPGGLGKNLLWSRQGPARHNSKTFIDSFAGDGNLDGRTISGGGANWVEVAGSEWVTANNRAEANNIPSDGDASARLDTPADSDDQYAQADIVVFTRQSGTRLQAGVACRCASDGSGGYSFVCIVDTDNAGDRLIYVNGGSGTIASDTTTTTSGTIRVTADGSSISAQVNGATVLGPVTNTEWSGATQRHAGIETYAFVVSTNDLALDNFEAGDIATGETITPDKWLPIERVARGPRYRVVTAGLTPPQKIN